MFGKLICWITRKHLRGKRIETVTRSDLTIEATMQCPRCKAKWVRREKPKQAKLGLALAPASEGKDDANQTRFEGQEAA